MRLEELKLKFLKGFLVKMSEPYVKYVGEKPRKRLNESLDKGIKYSNSSDSKESDLWINVSLCSAVCGLTLIVNENYLGSKK